MITSSKSPYRRAKRWWVALEGIVTYVVGYKCRGNKTWWFPEIGCSLSPNHLFESEKEALTYAICEKQKEITNSIKELQELKAQRKAMRKTT